MSQNKAAAVFFFALMGASGVLLAITFYPVFSELFLAAVLAGILWPLQRRFTRALRGRAGLSAFLLTFAVAAVIFGPLGTLTTYGITEGSRGLAYVAQTVRSEPVANMVERLPESLAHMVTDAIALMPSSLDDIPQLYVAEKGRAVAAYGVKFLLHTGLMLVALFFLLTQGDRFVEWLDSASPLRPGQTRELFETFKKVSLAVTVSTAITGSVQAVVALVGYLIAGVPSPIFFAVITFFFGFVPAIGAGTICFAAALLLLATGAPYKALFLALWALFVVSLVDNVVKPALIRRDMELHGAVVFFSLFGGLAAFGAIGLLLGPLAVALFLTFLRMYHRDFSSDARETSVPGLSKNPGALGRRRVK